MPLLLRSLDLPDLEMRANVIDTLLSIAQDEASDENAGKSGVISEHASTIVGALLKNCSIENAASPVSFFFWELWIWMLTGFIPASSTGSIEVLGYATGCCTIRYSSSTKASRDNSPRCHIGRPETKRSQGSSRCQVGSFKRVHGIDLPIDNLFASRSNWFLYHG